MRPRPIAVPTAPDPVLEPSPVANQAATFSARWRGALARSRLVRALRPWTGLATCLMYHRVCPDQAQFDDLTQGFAPNRELSVTVSAFDAQMAFIAQHFNCLSLPAAVDQLARGQLLPRSMVVTFDDGYLDNLTLALPILRKHAIPATVYIATGLIDQSKLPWWYELEQLIAISDGFSLDWHKQRMRFSTTDAATKLQAFNTLNPMLKLMEPTEQAQFMELLRECSKVRAGEKAQLMKRHQLKELATDPLITIGAHTHNHLALRSLNPIRMRQEIIHSRTLLENWLERPIEHLAYPFGGQAHASTREFGAAAELGFSSAVTTQLGHIQKFHRNHLLALPRIGIGYQDCMARFEWKLSGLYSMVRRPRSRVAH